MKKIGKNKHIGIYIHHQDKEHWLRIKELLPYFSCKVTLISSLDLSDEVRAQAHSFLRLPEPETNNPPNLFNGGDRHKRRMALLLSFIRDHRPDLFYIDESVEVATFVNLLGIPYVYARMKEGEKSDLAHQQVYAMSLFNLATYESAREEDWYKKTPFYHKTKYPFKESCEVSKKIFCMYLEEEVCALNKNALAPFLLNAL